MPEDFGLEEISQDIETVENEVEETGDEQVVDGETEGTGKPEATVEPEKYSAKSITEAIKSASEQNPEQTKLFKKLQDAYFRNQAFEKAFPSAAEAASVKQLITDIGGVEGIESLQQSVHQYQQLDQYLADGNPEALEAIFKDFSSGVGLLAPTFLDKLAATNVEAYNNAVYPHAIGMIAGSAMPRILGDLVNETDGQKLQAGIQKLVEWYNKSYEAATNMYGKNKSAPVKDTKLDEREKALNERETQTQVESFKKVISDNTNSVLNNEVEKYAKQYKLAESQKNIFKKHLIATIDKEQEKDATYQKQYQIRANTPGMTMEKLGKFVSDDLNKRLRDRTFGVVKEIYGAPKAGSVQNKVIETPKAGTAKTAANGAPYQIKTKPDGTDVDWSKPDSQMNFIAQRAWMKSGPYKGKFVTWKQI